MGNPPLLVDEIHHRGELRLPAVMQVVSGDDLDTLPEVADLGCVTLILAALKGGDDRDVLPLEGQPVEMGNRGSAARQ